jgi:hypothetical protein
MTNRREFLAKTTGASIIAAPVLASIAKARSVVESTAPPITAVPVDVIKARYRAEFRHAGAVVDAFDVSAFEAECSQPWAGINSYGYIKQANCVSSIRFDQGTDLDQALHELRQAPHRMTANLGGYVYKNGRLEVRWGLESSFDPHLAQGLKYWTSVEHMADVDLTLLTAEGEMLIRFVGCLACGHSKTEFEPWKVHGIAGKWELGDISQA